METIYIVFVMENINDNPDPAAARAALTEIAEAERAIRDTPWPTWLYPVNAILLGALALTGLLEKDRSGVLLAVALTVIAVNLAVGYRMGTPWALPTSRAFLASVYISAGCVVLAMVVAAVSEASWPVIALAVGATISYAIGSVFHRRRTAR
jgi:hypothetical protein